jgi:hypothetical protein
MTDPFTMTAVGATVLTEGIKFLYGQAGAAVKAWRQRRAAGPVAEGERSEEQPVEFPPDTFEGSLVRPQLDFSKLAVLEDDIQDLRKALTDYVEGIDAIDPSDQDLVSVVNGLRDAMEAVYGQPITFRGERRPPQDLTVTGEAYVGDVHGYVAGLRAKGLVEGELHGELHGTVVAGDVGVGGSVVGVDIGPGEPGTRQPPADPPPSS